MRWASALSNLPAGAAALEECAAAVGAELLGAPADLVVAFVSPHHRAAYAALPDLLAARFPRAHILGCSGGGVIGAGHEVEDGPALSITAAVLPAVDVMPLRFDAEPAELAPLLQPPEGFILLCDPFSSEPDQLVSALDRAYPRAPKIGGLVSGGSGAGENALLLDGTLYRDGAVGVALAGDIVVDTLVAQGCRAVGRPFPIGRCERNVILDLGGRKPVEVIRELYASLEPADQALLRRGLHVGLEMREEDLEYHQGELLVRNLIGMDPDSGAIAIGALPHPWQVLQFMLRDAHTADHDLTRLLDQYQDRPAGALLFSCLGRGERLFGTPDHDSALFRRRLGPVALGGFFCNGEIGPVGRTTFLHGFTSSFGLFRGKSS